MSDLKRLAMRVNQYDDYDEMPDGLRREFDVAVGGDGRAAWDANEAPLEADPEPIRKEQERLEQWRRKREADRLLRLPIAVNGCSLGTLHNMGPALIIQERGFDRGFREGPTRSEKRGASIERGYWDARLKGADKAWRHDWRYEVIGPGVVRCPVRYESGTPAHP